MNPITLGASVPSRTASRLMSQRFAASLAALPHETAMQRYYEQQPSIESASTALYAKYQATPDRTTKEKTLGSSQCAEHRVIVKVDTPHFQRMSTQQFQQQPPISAPPFQTSYAQYRIIPAAGNNYDFLSRRHATSSMTANTSEASTGTLEQLSLPESSMEGDHLTVNVLIDLIDSASCRWL